MTRREKICAIVAHHLKELERIFAAPYRMTFVARHPELSDADVVVTSDPDLEAVCSTIRGLEADEASLVSKGTEEPAP